MSSIGNHSPMSPPPVPVDTSAAASPTLVRNLTDQRIEELQAKFEQLSQEFADLVTERNTLLSAHNVSTLSELPSAPKLTMGSLLEAHGTQASLEITSQKIEKLVQDLHTFSLNSGKGTSRQFQELEKQFYALGKLALSGPTDDLRHEAILKQAAVGLNMLKVQQQDSRLGPPPSMPPPPPPSATSPTTALPTRKEKFSLNPSEINLNTRAGRQQLTRELRQNPNALKYLAEDFSRLDAYGQIKMLNFCDQLTQSRYLGKAVLQSDANREALRSMAEKGRNSRFNYVRTPANNIMSTLDSDTPTGAPTSSLKERFLNFFKRTPQDTPEPIVNKGKGSKDLPAASKEGLASASARPIEISSARIMPLGLRAGRSLKPMPINWVGLKRRCPPLQTKS